VSPNRERTPTADAPGFLITEMHLGEEAAPPPAPPANRDPTDLLEEIGFDFEPDEGEEELRPERGSRRVETDELPPPPAAPEERTTLLDRPAKREAPPPDRSDLARTVVDQDAPDWLGADDDRPGGEPLPEDALPSGELPEEIPLPDGGEDWSAGGAGLPPEAVRAEAADGAGEWMREEALPDAVLPEAVAEVDAVAVEADEPAAEAADPPPELPEAAEAEDGGDVLGDLPSADDWGEPDTLLTWSAVSDSLPPSMRDAAASAPERAGEKLERDSLSEDVLDLMAGQGPGTDGASEPERDAPDTAGAPAEPGDGTFAAGELPPVPGLEGEDGAEAGGSLSAAELSSILPADTPEDLPPDLPADPAPADGEADGAADRPESAELTAMGELPEAAPGEMVDREGETLEREADLDDVFGGGGGDAAEDGAEAPGAEGADAAELFREDLGEDAASLEGMDIDAALEAGLEAERQAEDAAAAEEAALAEEAAAQEEDADERAAMEESAADLFAVEGAEGAPRGEDPGGLEQLFGGADVPADFGAALEAAPAGRGGVPAAPGEAKPVYQRAAAGAVLAVGGSVALVDHVFEVRKNWRLYVNLLAAAISAVSVTVIVLGLMR
jgi:hypothetical protein